MRSCRKNEASRYNQCKTVCPHHRACHLHGISASFYGRCRFRSGRVLPGVRGSCGQWSSSRTAAYRKICFPVLFPPSHWAGLLSVLAEYLPPCGVSAHFAALLWQMFPAWGRVAETRTHARRLHYGQETGINVRPPVYGDVTWTEISLLMISFSFPLYINDLYPYTKVTNNPDISIVLGNKNVE